MKPITFDDFKDLHPTVQMAGYPSKDNGIAKLEVVVDFSVGDTTEVHYVVSTSKGAKETYRSIDTAIEAFNELIWDCDNSED